VSIAAADAREVAREVQLVEDIVDVVEVRLDAMTDPDVAGCCQLVGKPLLFTHRPGWEGGEFNGFEDDRVRPLFKAIELQAAYIDYELRADPLLRAQLLEEISTSPTRMILSWHDFTSTPANHDLDEVLQQMQESGADIGKIITTAHGAADVLRLLKIQEKALAAGFALCCFAMGEAGRISRLATLYLGGYMSYCAVTEEAATAPGQFAAAQLHALCRQFEGER